MIFAKEISKTFAKTKRVRNKPRALFLLIFLLYFIVVFFCFSSVIFLLQRFFFCETNLLTFCVAFCNDFSFVFVAKNVLSQVFCCATLLLRNGFSFVLSLFFRFPSVIFLLYFIVVFFCFSSVIFLLQRFFFCKSNLLTFCVALRFATIFLLCLSRKTYYHKFFATPRCFCATAFLLCRRCSFVSLV